MHVLAIRRVSFQSHSSRHLYLTFWHDGFVVSISDYVRLLQCGTKRWDGWVGVFIYPPQCRSRGVLVGGAEHNRDASVQHTGMYVHGVLVTSIVVGEYWREEAEK